MEYLDVTMVALQLRCAARHNPSVSHHNNSLLGKQPRYNGTPYPMPAPEGNRFAGQRGPPPESERLHWIPNRPLGLLWPHLPGYDWTSEGFMICGTIVSWLIPL